MVPPPSDEPFPPRALYVVGASGPGYLSKLVVKNLARVVEARKVPAGFVSLTAIPALAKISREGRIRLSGFRVYRQELRVPALAPEPVAMVPVVFLLNNFHVRKKSRAMAVARGLVKRVQAARPRLLVTVGCSYSKQEQWYDSVFHLATPAAEDLLPALGVRADASRNSDDPPPPEPPEPLKTPETPKTPKTPKTPEVDVSELPECLIAACAEAGVPGVDFYGLTRGNDIDDALARIVYDRVVAFLGLEGTHKYDYIHAKAKILRFRIKQLLREHAGPRIPGTQDYYG